MDEFYTYGSEAYAPISIELPSHLPEEPKIEEPLIIEEKKGVSLLSVIGVGVAILLFLGLLISMIRLFEIRSEKAELQRQLRQLQTQQEHLIAQYESSIDMDEVARRAETMGMHIPWMDQIRYIHVDKPGTIPGTTEEASSGAQVTFAP